MHPQLHCLAKNPTAYEVVIQAALQLCSCTGWCSEPVAAWSTCCGQWQAPTTCRQTTLAATWVTLGRLGLRHLLLMHPWGLHVRWGVAGNEWPSIGLLQGHANVQGTVLRLCN